MSDASDSSPLAPPPKLDGRRTHVVDRALDYVALADQGLSASRIARRRRRSQGYVSIVLRLGRAIQGMEPNELAALRSPRVTWKLAQRIVRQDADVVSIRHQLRAALGGFSTHNVDGRKHRRGRRTSTEPSRAAGTAWGWDAAWFARDPVGYAEAHLRYLVGVQRNVQSRASRSAAARTADRVSVGQSIRTLQRSLAARTDQERVEPLDHSARSADERHAAAILAILDARLTEAATEIAALIAARTSTDVTPPRACPRESRSAAPSLPAGCNSPLRDRSRAVNVASRSADLADALADALEDDLRD